MTIHSEETGARALFSRLVDSGVRLTPTVPASRSGEPEPRPAEPMVKPHHDPLRGYVARLAVVDAVMVTFAVVFGVLVRFGSSEWGGNVDRSAWLLATGVALAWMLVLMLRSTYDTRVIGVGSEEFKRVSVATFVVFTIIATISYLTFAQISRGFVLVSLPAGLLLLLLGRWLMRVWLHQQRLEGDFLSRTIVVGSGLRGEELAAMLDADRFAGFVVVDQVEPPTLDLVELDDWLDDVLTRIRQHEADAVAVSQSNRISPEIVRRLAWRLEGPRVDLLIAPALSDVGGPRMSFRPASGLPLIHLDEPRLTGPRRFVKRVFDLVVATVGLLLLSPLMLLIAVLVKSTSRGPVLFVQERVGQAGETFRFPKFRSMVDGADQMRSDVIGAPDEEITDRYKADPRITAVGRVIRRFSLDELPQLVNVVGGSMSMVGPRPMLVEELPLLGESDHRRHLTRPGLTGVWQVSGRKEVPWEDRMRMDLEYVEKWSVALDLVIIAKTIKAVLVGNGAY
jgi:exopolysaccharide biosynthesis polyprenyl glycosylphosphotransferase